MEALLQIVPKTIRCANDEACPSRRPALPVPEWMLERETEKIKTEFEPGQYDGFYVSPRQFAYCCHRCFISYCD
jgi:hypothetical protein